MLSVFQRVINTQLTSKNQDKFEDYNEKKTITILKSVAATQVLKQTA